MSKKDVQVVEPVVEVQVVPAINDSAVGLQRMYEDLNPYAARLRSAAFPLLLFSILFMGSLEGVFGLIAAAGVLCCAAPGSLGVAHAARCTKICAMICATLSLMHIMCISAFSLMVMPEMPHAFHHVCPHLKSEMPPQVDNLSNMLPVQHADSDALILLPSSSATFVVTATTAAARRLQEVAPSSDVACVRAERLFTQAAPTFLMLAILIETCLFISALSTAKAAARITAAARAYGANGI